MGYIGKDIIHYGCGLELDPNRAWKAIKAQVRNKVRKAERAGVTVERRAGTAAELAELRAMWFYPDDPNFPSEIGPDDYYYAAVIDGELVGGMILLPVGSHLFLNNLTASDSGKKHGVQGFLLWHAVNQLADSGYGYLDVGVSYRPNLYQFFKSWATFHYPVIFNPPAIKPLVRFEPYRRPVDVADCSIDLARIAAFTGGRPYTIVPGVEHAADIARDAGAPFEVTGRPVSSSDGNLVIDLTRLLPVPYGALVVGVEVEPKQLWSRYGCFDFVKTDFLSRALSLAGSAPDRIAAARAAVFENYRGYFAREDVAIAEPAGFIDRFAFTTGDAERLEERFARFEVACERDGERLSFPCHQTLEAGEVEYVYAIYRGFLNLCSEWVPTHQRGALKGGTAVQSSD